MKRVMRAKKEDEELYKKVVSGEVSPKKSERIIVCMFSYGRVFFVFC